MACVARTIPMESALLAGIEKALGESPKVLVYYPFPGVLVEIDKDRVFQARAQVGRPGRQLSNWSPD